MRIKLNVAEYSIKKEYSYMADVLKEGKQLPVLSIGTDSYIEEAIVDTVIDSDCVYNVQVGRYSAVAHDVTFIVDMNHDYRRVSQGRITGVTYKRPEHIRRKGQIIIKNDCWIGEKAIILSGVTIGNGAVVAAGAVVSKDVPPFAIVAGNPARVIGYRFEEEQINALNTIRWWNWETEMVRACGQELSGDIDVFIDEHIARAKNQLELIQSPTINILEKNNEGPDKKILYIPDFEQDYPTYKNVIASFVKTYEDTNYELLLYVVEDEFLEEKINILNSIFAKYEDKNCYINIHVDKLVDERGLLACVDGYVTNRSQNNIRLMDYAEMYGLDIYSGVDIPVFK